MDSNLKTASEQALVSVIVPVYNTEQYLERCIQSICSQDYPNFELLLMDDGSTDRSGEICESWAKKDSRISVFHIENGGISKARNYGLDRINGDLITFIDSDDYVSTDYLSYLVSLISMDPDCLVASCNHFIVRGEKMAPNVSHAPDTRLLAKEEAFSEVLFHGCIDVTSCAKLYRRKVFSVLRFPVGRVYEDTWIFGDILSQTDTIVFGNKCCYYYIVRQQSTVRQKFSEKNLEYIEAAEKLANDALTCDPGLTVGAVRRVNHARLSVLQCMMDCPENWWPLRSRLRDEVLEDSRIYIRDPRTPSRDKAAVMLLRFGLKLFYFGWRLYNKLR